MWRSILLSVPILVSCLLVSAYAAPAPDTAEAAKALFAKPTKEYTTAPFWVWNDDLTEEQVRSTLRDLASQGVRQAFVHPRPGLITNYLSDDWFRLWKAALDEAEKLDVDLWIYDENSYPSGFAGGHVPEVMPEARGNGMRLREEKTPPAMTDKTFAVYAIKGDVCESITDRVRAGETFPEGRYIVAELAPAGATRWFGGRPYVDLQYPGLTQKFLEVTMGAYEREIGPALGKRVPGVFTDEPNLVLSGGVHWTEGLPKIFQERWGYSLLEHLPALRFDIGDWKRVRHDYYQTMSDLFVERWGKPYFEYCASKGLEFTGHYWEHEWPSTGGVPDNMAMSAWQQRPGIDILFNQYDEGPHAQVGNVRAVLELASIANQLGRARTLCETYGGSGWDMRFEDFKRIGDWVSVLGISMINEHLSHVSFRGSRKADYPPSFSYQSTWWTDYNALETYFTRVSAAITRGQQLNEVLIIEPTTTAYMYQGTHEGPMAVGKAFQELVTRMAQAQVEFDLGCEDIMARNGSVRDKVLVVGQRAYTTVILSPATENLNTKTVELLEAFLKAGGTVLACDANAPARVDGQESPRCAELAKLPGWKASVSQQDLLALRPADGFSVQRAADDKGILYHQRRQLADGDLVFLTNTSNKDATAGTIASHAASVEEWNLNTGEVTPYVFAKKDGGVTAEFTLPPCGSRLLFFSKNAGESAAPVPPVQAKAITPTGDMQIRRAFDNVLTLDYVDITAGGETKSGIHTHAACAFAFNKNGEPSNPWDQTIQYGDEIIKRQFPADSGFELTYKFTVGDTAPKSVAFVVERGDLYQITCNGTAIRADKSQWWMDRSFTKIDISSLVKPGENALVLKAAPMTMYHEIANAFLVGDFAVAPTDKGFRVEPARPLQLGAWNTQGCPFYGNKVSYTATFDVPEAKGRYEVSLPNWYGAVATVSVNGKPAAPIYHQPFTTDVTKLLTAGKNTVEVTVCGTLYNTLGPLHGHQPLGLSGPGGFANAPAAGPPAASEYSSIGYGLMEPFVLSNLQ